MRTYQDDVAVVDSAISLLEKNGISVRKGSSLDACCREVKINLEKHLNSELIDAQADPRATHRATSGLIRMFENLLRVCSNEVIPNIFIPHLKLLNIGSTSQASPYSELHLDNAAKNASDKIFELIIGLAAYQVGTELVMEHPKGGNGEPNPDILVTIDNERWGFALKVPNPSEPLSNLRGVRQRILEGFQQIENSPADRGYVIINGRNLFPYDILNPSILPLDKSSDFKYLCHRQESVNAIVKNWLISFGTKIRNNRNMCTVLKRCNEKVGFSVLMYLEIACDENVLNRIMPGHLTVVADFRFGEVIPILPSPVRQLCKELLPANSLTIDTNIMIPNFITVKH